MFTLSNQGPVVSPRRLFGAALLVAVLASAALTAWAQPHPGMHGGGPGMGMMGGRGLERMLDSVNATADQRAQIKAIADAAHTDLKAQHQAGANLHQQMAALFAQPTIDANAVEALRQQALAQHDQASRRITQAMVDASRVLSPEQRKQLVDKMGQRRALMQRHMQDMQQLDGKPAAK
jgi:protein CpxP